MDSSDLLKGFAKGISRARDPTKIRMKLQGYHHPGKKFKPNTLLLNPPFCQGMAKNGSITM